ncbi:T9SS type A sorting domain-containing protein [Gaetbulibacter sp. M240]|uniref:T9SS type A sorting domain-containing protein n=1 Tax=Gaetbulibacter sp. M240 TaxID=3126511 RepID=UPI00374FCD8A
MKNFYFSLLLILNSIFLIAQNNDFNNGGGDLLWSNTANWSLLEVPTTSNTGQVRLPLLVESLVDLDVTIKKIQTTFALAGDVSVAGANTLTVNPGVANEFGITNVSNNDIKLSFKGFVEVNNPAGFTYIENANGASNSIEFASGSTLTLTTNLSTDQGSNNAGFIFNGTLAGNGNLRFGANTSATFGSTSSNSGYTGQIVFLANSSATVNTADNTIFYEGPKIQVNGNSSIELNGANVFASGITVGGTNTFTLTANANQNNMSSIIFQGGGTLNIVVGAGVSDLTFADNSASDWSTGTVNITNYTEGVIRFGTSNTGLTTDQLAQISADNGGAPLALDNNGYLVNESSLSVDDFDSELSKPIAYPTLATDKLYFRTPQKDVQIISLNGSVLLSKKIENQLEITVDNLSPGLYFIVFDKQNVQKFVKQ